MTSTKWYWRTGLRALALLALGTMPIFAQSLNVLWYTGGTETGGGNFPTYEALVANLATQAATHGPTWNVTFWAGGTIPAGTFNVLVVASSDVGPWGPSNSLHGSNAALNAAISG